MTTKPMILTRLTGALVLTLLMSACMGLKSTVTTFHDLPATLGGESFVVLPTESSKEGSLEFRSYADRIASHLERRGLKRTANTDPKSATFVVLVWYGIDSGRTTLSSSPQAVYGQLPGTGNRGGNRPQYGVVGTATDIESGVEFTRLLKVEIFNTESIRAGKPKSRWEGVLKSSGSSGHLPEVLPRMIDSMFRDFPGQSGKTRTITN